MMFISKLWRGDYSLPITYWVFGVIGNIGLGIPMNLISPDSNPPVFYSLLTIAFVYSIVVAVGIWKSATKYQGLSWWKYLAKFVAILSFISVGATSVLLIPAFDIGKERTDYQLVSECRYDQLLKSKPNLETQIWITSLDYCQQIVFNHLKMVRPDLNLDDLLNFGATTEQAIIAVLGDSVKEKKFKPINKYQTVAQCKLDQLSRVQNSTNPNLYATTADQFCTEYIAYSLSQRNDFLINKAMTEGYTYKEIAAHLEANPKK